MNDYVWGWMLKDEVVNLQYTCSNEKRLKFTWRMRQKVILLYTNGGKIRKKNFTDNRLMARIENNKQEEGIVKKYDEK